MPEWWADQWAGTMIRATYAPLEEEVRIVIVRNHAGVV
eukprot:CAMPEP_0179284656 /NCGR_PEP_ID=MMETSP0797-20121207/38800_1 /TAXON_ID=47934 /ORGANISM="Dinophysis acuminata, Strain DAEP01" /LENGTH=37 /DNA_ID= /DNA_START= /DNA_END= /DNA_ORIENTATION=